MVTGVGEGDDEDVVEREGEVVEVVDDDADDGVEFG